MNKYLILALVALIGLSSAQNVHAMDAVEDSIASAGFFMAAAGFEIFNLWSYMPKFSKLDNKYLRSIALVGSLSGALLRIKNPLSPRSEVEREEVVIDLMSLENGRFGLFAVVGNYMSPRLIIESDHATRKMRKDYIIAQVETGLFTLGFSQRLVRSKLMFADIDGMRTERHLCGSSCQTLAFLDSFLTEYVVPEDRNANDIESEEKNEREK